MPPNVRGTKAPLREYAIGPSPRKGMLLTTFLAKNYDWAQEPHLYIVEQIPQVLENPAMRCGAAGTALYKDADAPFRSSESTQKGLQGRMTQYNNYFLPNIGKIHACLRIRKQLVALPFQRIAGDEWAEQRSLQNRPNDSVTTIQNRYAMARPHRVL